MVKLSDLDLRGLPVWERPSLVFEALDRLPTGTPLTFITENEPLGLTARISERYSGRTIVDSRAIGRGTWRISIRRDGADGLSHPAVALLASSPVFADLDASVRDRLAASGAWRAGRRGHALVDGVEEWPFVGVVEEGVAALSSGGGSERERILYDLFAHDVFGLVEYFDRGASMGKVVALSKNVRVLALPWDALTAATRECPELTAALATSLAQRQRLMAESLTRSALPILGRVARVLLPHAMPDRGLSLAMPAVGSMTQAQIAAAAGTVKEVAARAIAELESRGLLRRERGHIRYLDRQSLAGLIRSLS